MTDHRATTVNTQSNAAKLNTFNHIMMNTELDCIKEYDNNSNEHELPDNVWLSVFQLVVDENTHILSLLLFNRCIYSINKSHNSWIGLHFKTSFIQQFARYWNKFYIMFEYVHQ